MPISGARAPIQLTMNLQDGHHWWSGYISTVLAGELFFPGRMTSLKTCIGNMLDRADYIVSRRLWPRSGCLAAHIAQCCHCNVSHRLDLVQMWKIQPGVGLKCFLWLSSGLRYIALTSSRPHFESNFVTCREMLTYKPLTNSAVQDELRKYLPNELK
jgi:hypothetical protein